MEEYLGGDRSQVQVTDLEAFRDGIVELREPRYIQVHARLSPEDYDETQPEPAILLCRIPTSQSQKDHSRGDDSVSVVDGSATKSKKRKRSSLASTLHHGTVRSERRLKQQVFPVKVPKPAKFSAHTASLNSCELVKSLLILQRENEVCLAFILSFPLYLLTPKLVYCSIPSSSC